MKYQLLPLSKLKMKRQIENSRPKSSKEKVTWILPIASGGQIHLIIKKKKSEVKLYV